MSSILNLVKYLSSRYIDQNSIILDATCGNGHDTLFFAPNVKKIYAFDIQEKAIDNAKERTKDFNNIKYILDSHQNIDKYISQKLDLVIFNLGYLPNSDKKITTHFETTKDAFEKSLELLNSKKAIIITLYPGTIVGKDESDNLVTYLEQIDKNRADIFIHKLINKPNNPPFICEIIKR
jgi:methylase of polypeptide subunit release factors